MMLSFDKQFAEAVATGKKRQTIRAYRKDKRRPSGLAKRQWRVGDTAHIWTGPYRPGQRRMLGVAEITGIVNIVIHKTHEPAVYLVAPEVGYFAAPDATVVDRARRAGAKYSGFDGLGEPYPLTTTDLDHLYRADGFDSEADWWAYFGDDRFQGVILFWDQLIPCGSHPTNDGRVIPPDWFIKAAEYRRQNVTKPA